jgi:hypothetical protein
MIRRHPYLSQLSVKTVAIASVLVLGATIIFFMSDSISSSNLYPSSFYGTGTIPKEPRLHLVLPLDQNAHGTRSCMVLASALINGYKPLVINWHDSKEHNAGEHQIAKVHGMLDFLRRDDSYFDSADDLVMMVDALDAWFQLPPSILISRYRNAGNEVVIGAGMGCWPNKQDTPACTGIPESPLPVGTFGMKDGKEVIERPKHANSGLVIAPRARLRQFYEELARAFDLPRDDIAVSDQGPFNDFLLDGKLTLDYSYRLIWNNGGNAKSGIPINTGNPAVVGLDRNNPETGLIPWHLLPSLIWHRHTGEIPVIVHFNQFGQKGTMEKWWTLGQPWYASKESRFRRRVVERLEGDDAVITMVHDGSKRRFFDLCPASMLDLSIEEDGSDL